MKSENKEIISLSPQLQLKLDSETKPAALSEPQLASEPSASGTQEHQRAPQPNSEAYPATPQPAEQIIQKNKYINKTLTCTSSDLTNIKKINFNG